jgi:hypothetical protein
VIQLPETLAACVCWLDALPGAASNTEAPCADVRERLELIAVSAPRGADYGEAIADLAGHVASCPACWHEYEDLRWILREVEQASLQEPDSYPPCDFSFLTDASPQELEDALSEWSRLAAGE